MLKITVPKRELFDNNTNEFIYVEKTNLTLEHSLVSISKWESKWHKSYISSNGKLSAVEILDYIKCMTITQNVDPNVYLALTKENLEQIQEYISDPATATTTQHFKKQPNNKNKIITAEVIYSWMISLHIPVEFQKWHLNRLLTLIDVCQMDQNPESNKMSAKDTKEYYRKTNAARRKAAAQRKAAKKV